LDFEKQRYELIHNYDESIHYSFQSDNSSYELLNLFNKI